MASFNKVILMGRLTSAPELKSANGTYVTSFNIAVDRRYTKEGQDKQTDFITIVAWRQTAEFISKYFRKGSAILVCGELQTRSWEDNNGNKCYATEVIASEVSFCEAKRDSEGNNTPQSTHGSVGASATSYNPYTETPNTFEPVFDGNLPF